MRLPLVLVMLTLFSPAVALAAARCPNVLIVLDASDSMGQPPSSATTESKISIAQRVLTDLLEGSTDAGLAAPNAGIRFGFTSFPDVTNCAAGKTDPLPQECGYGDNAATAAAIQSVTLHNSTPTAKTLAAVALTSDMLDATRPKYVLVLTDGQPTCGDTGSESVAAIDTLRDGGAETFVVGFGDVTASTSAVKVLNEMAAAGQPPLVDGGSAEFYPATDATSLAQALGAIIATTTSELGTSSSCDPCEDLTCAPAQRCDVTATGPVCVADPCAVATCATGDTCEAADGGYLCIAPPDAGPRPTTSGSSSGASGGSAAGSTSGGKTPTAVSGSCGCSSANFGMSAMLAVILLGRRARRETR